MALKSKKSIPTKKLKPKPKVIAKPQVKNPVKAPPKPKKKALVRKTPPAKPVPKPIPRKMPPPKPKKAPKLVAAKKTGRKKLTTITAKERKLIRAKLEGKTNAEAAVISGLNPTYIPVALAKPHVAEKFSQLLDQAGLSDSRLSVKIRDLTEAKDKRFFAHNGVVLSERTVPAHEVQRKTVEMVCKMKGHMVERVENELGPNLLSRLFMVPCKPTLEEWTPDG